MLIPTRKLDVIVDVTPTVHGMTAAPRLASMNITLPSRVACAPNALDNSAIVIGYTTASPSPIKVALTKIAASDPEPRRAATPSKAIATHARTTFASETLLNSGGASPRPASNPP